MNPHSTRPLQDSANSAGVTTTLRWLAYRTPPRDGVANMALDHALMRYVERTGDAVLRVYAWSAPTLSLGRNQRARGRYDLDRARDAGVAIVRRPTGGRAVLHWREITYSVAAPVGPLGSLRESYGWINRLLVDGLRRIGVNAYITGRTGVPPTPGLAPCFEEPVAGELCAGGRKLVGSAQVREHDVLLQHGSILVDDDQGLASALLVVPAPPPPSPATLRALLGRTPSLDEVADALTAALGDAEPLVPDDELARDERELRAFYEDPAWTWRR